MQRKTVTAAAGFLVFGALLAGCGRGSGVDRMPLQGAVIAPRGEKLNGSITFLPAQGHKGPSATTAVIDGHYQFDRVNGPTAGLHTIVVRRKASRIAAVQSPESERAAPLKTEWTVAADVADDGKHFYDVTLKD